MASTQLGMGATTLNHWCGIMDGRYSGEQLHELMLNDDRFAVSKERILMTDVLFIDEIGMISKKIFETVELVCRLLKGNDRVFGGLQVIASGDFKQLQPVPNHWHNDDGSFCFQSVFFKQTFPHHINLKKVMRQSEIDLINAVNELCDGSPSEDTINVMKELSRPLPDCANDKTTFLFGTRFDVNYVNMLRLEDMQGQAVYFKATDEGFRNPKMEYLLSVVVYNYPKVTQHAMCTRFAGQEHF